MEDNTGTVANEDSPEAQESTKPKPTTSSDTLQDKSEGNEDLLKANEEDQDKQSLNNEEKKALINVNNPENSSVEKADANIGNHNQSKENSAKSCDVSKTTNESDYLTKSSSSKTDGSSSMEVDEPLENYSEKDYDVEIVTLNDADSAQSSTPDDEGKVEDTKPSIFEIPEAVTTSSSKKDSIESKSPEKNTDSSQGDAIKEDISLTCDENLGESDDTAKRKQEKTQEMEPVGEEKIDGETEKTDGLQNVTTKDIPSLQLEVKDEIESKEKEKVEEKTEKPLIKLKGIKDISENIESAPEPTTMKSTETKDEVKSAIEVGDRKSRKSAEEPQPSTAQEKVDTAEKAKLLGHLSLMVNRRRDSNTSDDTVENLIEAIDSNEPIIDKDQEDLRQKIIKQAQQTKEEELKKAKTVKAGKKTASAKEEPDDVCILEEAAIKQEKPAKISIKPVETLKETKKPTGSTPPPVKSYGSAKKKTGTTQVCAQCRKRQYCKFKLVDTKSSKTPMSFLHFCSETCVFKFQGIKKNTPAASAAAAAVGAKKAAVPKLVPMLPKQELPLCVTAAQATGKVSGLERNCTWCSTGLDINNPEVLAWETFEFCSVNCLKSFQRKIGSSCSQCSKPVPLESLGKYCVRFGCNVNQFCVKKCLDEFKLKHRPCFLCQTNMSGAKNMYRVDKKLLTRAKTVDMGRCDNYLDFCDASCFRVYTEKFKVKRQVVEPCAVCRLPRPVTCQVQDTRCDPNKTPATKPLCSGQCLKAYTFVNKINPVCCHSCSTYFDDSSTPGTNGRKHFYKIFFQGEFKVFCDKLCHTLFVQAQRIIVECAWCRVKKYNFDMIVENVNSSTAGQTYLCSMNCLTYFSASASSQSLMYKKVQCDNCAEAKVPRFHVMADSSLKNFCSYMCTLNYQKKTSTAPGIEKILTAKQVAMKLQGARPAAGRKSAAAPAPTNAAAGAKGASVKEVGQLIISDVRSLAASSGTSVQSDEEMLMHRIKQIKDLNTSIKPAQPKGPTLKPKTTSVQFSAYKKGPPPCATDADLNFALKLTKPPIMCNKVTQVKPMMITKGVYCKPLTSTRNIQTGEDIGMPKIIPVPVPIYVPAPMAMYSVPFPVPVPVPVPVPIPVFIPTTRNSIKGIMKEIQNIYEKIPSDPFEAEMLLMAQMAASSADPAPPVDTSDSEAENGNTVSGGCKENVAPVNDLSSMQPLPSEGIVDYSLSHFLPVSDVAVPVQCAEAEVATSNPEPVIDLIDAESSLQLSKIVKSAATPAVQRAAIEDVVPSGPVRKPPASTSLSETRPDEGNEAARFIQDSGGVDEIAPVRTVHTRRSLAASSGGATSSGKYVESAHLTPEDFIPTEYLVDEEGNLVFDATSTMKSPPGMYQSDEDFCPDYSEDVDDPDFEEELPRKRKRSTPLRRSSGRSRQSAGGTQSSSHTPIPPASSITRVMGAPRTGRGGNKRKFETPANLAAPKANLVTTIAPAVETRVKSNNEVSLKYMLGVDALNKFIAQKNLELERSGAGTGGRGPKLSKLFKTDLLSMTPDELNLILCFFIKEVRRPNGSEYAPDTMYYLCLCIQYYLIKHDRIDNIFCDPYYRTFISTLDEIAHNFIKAYNDTDVIVTRVEEEYLWESKQLGAYSPHTLINTLMYFNTKYFLRFSLGEHEKLSFQRLTINWKFGLKKGPKILRMLIMDDSMKLTKIELEEDVNQPLRCPVKLYEFYMSKCPDTVKNSYDLLYLAPEHSCVPESPIWFSNTKLDTNSVSRTLNRIKMVKEIVSIM